MLDPRLAALAFVAVLVSSCAATSSGRAEYEDGWWSVMVGEKPRQMLVSYRGGALPSAWESQRASAGDFAFYNRPARATIYGDTSCGKRYEDAPLTVLINHLVLGFTEVDTVSQTERELASRGAMERIATGRLDGVAVTLGLTVVRKGPCVFDLVLIAPPDRFDASLTDYRAFVDGFDARVAHGDSPRRAGSRAGQTP